MIVPTSPFPFTALIVPLLTCGAAWAIAVWALKQDSPRTEFHPRLKAPRGASGHASSAEPPRHNNSHDSGKQSDEETSRDTTEGEQPCRTTGSCC
ncbi:hypothetical protein [uncultured Hyphomicrobium sp.]|uniref:hypothetical protein n=1 Tax=uncultured Hyphomicrobium sp. TaxID=194373 RepID=UPI00260016D6|nr:hypothetical protein [uncultured Hyphomicrobium sp.]